MMQEVILVDTVLREVRIGETIVGLTRIECGVLVTFASRSGKFVTYGKLLAETWGDSLNPGLREDRNLVKIHVSRLRRKLGVEFESRSGVGYRLKGKIRLLGEEEEVS